MRYHFFPARMYKPHLLLGVYYRNLFDTNKTVGFSGDGLEFPAGETMSMHHTGFVFGAGITVHRMRSAFRLEAGYHQALNRSNNTDNRYLPYGSAL